MEQASVRRGWGFRLGLALLFLVALGFGGAAFLSYLETSLVATGPNGKTTPATVGLKYGRVAITSHGRTLDGYLVRADPVACPDAPALVIFHGLGQTISQWVAAQLFLHDHCVSSLVFDYAGSGDSSRGGSIADIAEDAPAVYAFAQTGFQGARVFVLGHGFANAPLLEAAAAFPQRPSGIIIANAAASLRATTSRSPSYGLIAAVLPDWWNNVTAVVGVRAPLLVIGSDGDTVNPIQDTRDIYAVANQPKALAEPPGFDHDALYRAPNEAWWQPVLDFMKARPAGR